MIRSFGVVACLCAASLVTATETINEQFKIVPQDLERLDAFGAAVALDGNLAAIIDPLSDTVGPFEGTAYLYDATTGERLRRFVPDAPGILSQFNVAMDAGRVLVGGGERIGDEFNRYVWVFDVATGDQIRRLSADAIPPIAFGGPLALSGDIALIGASSDEQLGRGVGAAYLFDLATDSLPIRLTPPGATTFDRFGSAVAIDGDLALVGAPGTDLSSPDSGAAYLIDAATGDALRPLVPDDPTEADRFGTSVALLGDLALVGAPGDDDGVLNSGAVYVFDTATGDQLMKLKSSDNGRRDQFGTSLTANGQFLLASTNRDDPNRRIADFAYLFDLRTGRELQKLAASDGRFGDRFGQRSLALDGRIAMIGARDDTTRVERAGSVYVFRVVPEPGSVALAWAACCWASVGPLFGRVRP
ncbi:MAG: hypothetical protein AAGJ46_01240 [Planctomycetota bacterium]